MLQEPLGIFVFIVSLIYWGVAIFKPTKPSKAVDEDTPTSDTSSRTGAVIAQIGFLIVLTLATSLGLYALLQDFERAPARAALLLAGIAFLGWLLLARPERFALLLIGGIVVLGSVGLLGKCSTNGSDSLDNRPPRSL